MQEAVMGCCRGICCAAFPYTATPEALTERWKDYEPRTEQEEDWRRDDLYIADMLIPLKAEETKRRCEEYGLHEGVSAMLVELPPMYTCSHWDSDTKLCTVYDERPQMCREFPYARPCEHGCDYRPSAHIVTKHAAIAVKQVVLDG